MKALRRAVGWVSLLGIWGCVSDVRPPPADLPPPWQVELEGLRAAHFLHGTLDVVGQRRLEALLDFAEGDHAQADLVAEALDTPDAHRRRALRALAGDAPGRFDEAAAHAIERAPEAPGNGALIAGARIVDEAHPLPALSAALRARWRALPAEARLLAARTPALVDGIPSPALDLRRLADLEGPGSVELICELESPWSGSVWLEGPPAARLRVTLGGASLLGRDPETWRAGRLQGAALALEPGKSTLIMTSASALGDVQLWLLPEEGGEGPRCAPEASASPRPPIGIELSPIPSLATRLAKPGMRPGAWAALREAWWWAAEPIIDDLFLTERLLRRWRGRWPLDADLVWAEALHSLRPSLLPAAHGRRLALRALRETPKPTARVTELIATLSRALADRADSAQVSPPLDRPAEALAALVDLLEAEPVGSAVDLIALITPQGGWRIEHRTRSVPPQTPWPPLPNGARPLLELERPSPDGAAEVIRQQAWARWLDPRDVRAGRLAVDEATTPLARARLWVLWSVGAAVHVEGVGLPAPEAITHDRLSGFGWRLSGLRAPPLEPLQPPRASLLPGVSWRITERARPSEPTAEPPAEVWRAALYPTPRLLREVARITEGSTPEAALTEILGAVRRRVHHDPSRRWSEPPTHAWVRQVGDRTLLTCAMLEAAGLRCEPVLARTKADRQRRLILKIGAAAPWLFVDPAEGWAAPGALDPILYGGTWDALPRADKGRPASGTLPSDPPPTWDTQLTWRLRPTGELAAELRLKGRGEIPERLGRALAEVDEGGRGARLLTALSGGVGSHRAGALEGARITDVRLHAPDEGVEISARLTMALPRPGVLHHLPLSVGFGPEGCPDPAAANLLAERATPLVIPAGRCVIRHTLRGPPGWRLDPKWASFDLVESVGRARQTITSGPEASGEWTISRTVQVGDGWIPVNAYPTFSSWSQAIQSSLRPPLRWGPGVSKED